MTGESNQEAATPNDVADVLAPVAVDIAYSYRVPAGLHPRLGQFVEIPLGRSYTTGVIWALRESAGGDNFKSIAKLRDWAPLRKPLLDLIDWVSRWTLAPRGMVLRMATRAPEAAGAPAPQTATRGRG
jgi:primosomal protein N' (replication factor Y) (superfamily II helicase)